MTKLNAPRILCDTGMPGNYLQTSKYNLKVAKQHRIMIANQQRTRAVATMNIFVGQLSRIRDDIYSSDVPICGFEIVGTMVEFSLMSRTSRQWLDPLRDKSWLLKGGVSFTSNDLNDNETPL